MCQRRAGDRSETTAARFTLENIAHHRAAIYPLLTVKLLPRLVRRRPVDRGDLPARHAEVHRELPAVMDHVRQQEPEEVEPPYVPHLFRPGEELERGRALPSPGIQELLLLAHTHSLRSVLER